MTKSVLHDKMDNLPGSQMCDRRLTKSVVVFATAFSLAPGFLLGQGTPRSPSDPFDVEPPLLVKPTEPESTLESGEAAAVVPDPAKLASRLEEAKKAAISAVRLVRTGVLSKVEAEERTLRVVRLESELAKARMIAAQKELTSQKGRLAAGQATQAEVESAAGALAQATAAAHAAEGNYHKAQLENAELNLRRQHQLLKLGSAHKSDVTRAEEKLANLQQAEPGRY